MPKNKPKVNSSKSFSKKGIFPYRYAFTLLIPLRNIFLSPRQLIKWLELKDNMNVMELGPGPGYFSLKVAQMLINGKLVLADIQKEMLDYARKRAEKKGLNNVEYYLCDGNSFQFEENIFDRIFMVTVLGEVENKDVYMEEFYRILKKGGMLSISELAGDPDKMTANEIKLLAEDHNFSFYAFLGTEKNYTLNFIKKA